MKFPNLLKKAFFSASIIGFLFLPHYAFSASRDLTYTSCTQLLDKGFKNMSISNRLYLMGRENGIEEGIRSTFKEYKLKNVLLDEGYGEYVMKNACKIVLDDTTEIRGMEIFDAAVYKIITKKIPLTY